MSLSVRILIVNAGSSSLKLNLLDGEQLDRAQELPVSGADLNPDQIAAAVGQLGPIDAVGHRIVHGGDEFRDAVRVTPSVIVRLRRLADLAPLHQAKSLAALDATSRILPNCPAVACFDTAFHATIPPGAATYALPRAWRGRWGLRRFGFHGLFHAYAARRAAELLGQPLEGLRIVTCHLGAGASLAAVHHGRSVDTTMGFTPLEGLAMATRSGSVDPGLLLWLLEHTELTEEQVSQALERESGMVALAGTADMRAVIDQAASGDDDAQLGLEVYLHRLRSAIAAMAAAMNGLDVVVWTGGVGEHAPAIRAGATGGLSFLGLRIEQDLNQTGTGDRDVTSPGAAVRSLIVSAREDLEIARQVRCALT